MDPSRLCVDAEGYMMPFVQNPPPSHPPPVQHPAQSPPVQHPPQSPPVQHPAQSPPVQHPPQSPPLPDRPEVLRSCLQAPNRPPRPCSPREAEGKVDYNGMLYRAVMPVFKRHISVTDLMDCPDISNILTEADMDRVGSRVRADGNTDAASYLLKVLKTKAGWFDHLLAALDNDYLKLQEVKPLFLREKESVDTRWFAEQANEKKKKENTSPTEDRTYGNSTSPPAHNTHFAVIPFAKQTFEIYERPAAYSPYYVTNPRVISSPVEESMGHIPPTAVQNPSQPVSPNQKTRSPACPVVQHELSQMGSLSLREEPRALPHWPVTSSPVAATSSHNVAAAPQAGEHPYDKSDGPDSLLNVCWFHKDLSRDAAEILLKNTVAGSFVVRKSPGKFHYSLSLKCTGKVAHFVLDETVGNDGRISYSLGEETTYRFTCITSLVRYYTHSPVFVRGESGRGLRLSNPVYNYISMA